MFAAYSNALKTTVREAAKDEKGTIAILFGLSAFVVVMVTGLAIDVGRAMHAERTISNAIDSAALAAAKSMRGSGMTDAEVESMAEKYFEANMRGHGGSYANISSFAVNVDRASNSVAINVEGDVPTIFGNVGGISKLSISRASVAIFDTKNIEIGLQLDVTGSMCSPCSKIAALKDAVAGPDGLLDVLMPDGGTTNAVRIGLAPFASGVNAGPYAALVSNGRAGASGCVYERKDLSLQTSEIAPAGSTGAMKVKADLPKAGGCPPNAEVMALSNSKSALRTEINSWSTSTSTAGHLGAAWAWYLISPEWASIWGGTAPASYGDGRTEKYVILMTDGEYNTVGGEQKTSNVAPSKRYAVDTCTAMKAKGVVVYTVGFQVKPTETDNLRACASNPSKFYDAANEDTLKAAFRAIAEEINSLRLSS